jgi:4-amino-4-deoxy-L-arabinose transferase-like glycosyltransferase
MSPDRRAFEIDLFVWLKRLWRWWVILLIGAIIAIIWKVTVDESAPATAPEYQVRVVNTIPSGRQRRGGQLEPFLAVNPQNSDEMVISGHQLGRAVLRR